MNPLTFFPSGTLAWYMARTFLLRSFFILMMLVLVLMSLDLLGESGKILAVPGNGDAEIWRYIGLRLPQIVARFLPFSVLLGTLVTLVTLNQNSEIVSMKSAGMSAHQILAPLIFASLFVACLSFTFNDRIVARSTAALSAWDAVDYAQVPRERGVRTNVWVRGGDDLIRAGVVRGSGSAVTLSDVTVYRRISDRMATIIKSPAATWTAAGWVLSDARIFDVRSGRQGNRMAITLAPDATPDRFTLASVKGDELAFAPLRSAIAELKAAGRPTRGLEGALWHKIASPLSAILMPLLGAVAGFGLARSGRLFLRAVIGMGLGFTYFVVDNFALAMGDLGAYPPWLAAWGPFLLFALIGEMVLVRTEE